MAPALSGQNRKDFVADQDVRWCPGCGDYSILANVQRVMPDIGVRRENTVFVSGIGCSSRFPYYMNTYGFHTIHGRAPAFASGIKAARPDLSVWVVTGDGDGLSIGGNHLLHSIRRNLDIQILLFNNRVYGLTKGQYSPTSELGMRTKSSPQGSIDHPIDPISFALGAGATFVARTIDVDAPHMQDTLRRAHEHRGTALVEILQNCPVFNDGIFDLITDRKTGPAYQLWLEHGQPMKFGPNAEKGLRLKPKTLSLEVVTIGEDGVTDADIVIHDETNPSLAWMLADLPDVVALGVIYRQPGPVYNESLKRQRELAEERFGAPDLHALLRQGHTWTVS